MFVCHYGLSRYCFIYYSHLLLRVSARSDVSNHSDASSKPAVDPRHTKFLECKFVTLFLLLQCCIAVAAAIDFAFVNVG